MEDEEYREFLLAVAKATDDNVEKAGMTPESGYGVVTMVLAANGGKMEEDLLTVLSITLDKAAQVAKITGRQPIYEFVADVLVEVGR